MKLRISKPHEDLNFLMRFTKPHEEMPKFLMRILEWGFECDFERVFASFTIAYISLSTNFHYILFGTLVELKAK